MEDRTLEEEENSQAAVPGSHIKPTVVGIGASAGGLAALKRFFELVPEESGLAFVVVVHLSPEHKSHLVDLLQPTVRFPVRQVTETTPLEPNNVYVIPPNANLSAIDTHLRLSKLEEQRRERAPIDHFFRTLASTHDGHAIGVILTGTGSDGTLGLKEIKAKGGLILVQDPNDAEYDGMPQSAIATGLVDRILPLAELPQALLRLAHLGPRIALRESDEESATPERLLLPKVLAVLKARTDRDFSPYKPATMLRRIARRMQLNYIENFDHYLEKLHEQRDEARALADDLLITVTSFFRDTEVFGKLEKDVIPKLFEGKGVGDSLRIWTVGCATGEEAYSVAMLLLEEAARRAEPPRIQVFASDLHKRSLEGAREGLYSGDIQTDVTSARLKRFFQRENGGYRISKEVRDTVVFAPHNLLGDPPFSRLNLITCRNLLIYLDRSVQHDVIDLFHYALCPHGYLLLGSAETIDASQLFRTEDKKLCLYQKRNVPAPEPRLPVFPLTHLRNPGESLPKSESGHLAVRYQSLHQNLLEEYAPPSILVGPDNRLVHLSDHSGKYLVHPGGEVTSSVLRLVRDELQIELQALLQAARDRKELVDSKPIQVRFNGHAAPVVMHVRPAQDPEQDGFVLVIFDERHHRPEEPDGMDAKSAQPAPRPETGQESKRVAELEAELAAARQRLQTIIEEYETSREEMKASNEEMQSTNEELRSTMEELETSKEELQSINEELQTVNQENRHKVEELSQLSGDLQNLLSATDIATLFLDRDLRILRFTPRLAELFNIRITDRGRPISDLTHRLGYIQLREDAQAVLDRLIPTEREIKDEAGRWYLTRVLPYRSTDDRIEGAVITFTEITSRKSAEMALRESEERQIFLLKLSDTLHTLSDSGEIQKAAMRMLGEHLGLSRAFYFRAEREEDDWVHEVDSEYRRDPKQVSMVGRHSLKQFGTKLFAALEHGQTLEVADIASVAGLTPEERASYRTFGVAAFVNVPLLRNGEYSAGITVHDAASRAWKPAEIALIRDVAARAWDAIGRSRAEAALRASEEKFRSLFESIDEGFCIVEVLLNESGEAFDYRFLEVNPAFVKHTGLTAAAGKTILELSPEHEKFWFDAYGEIARTGRPRRFEHQAQALNRWYDVYAFRIGAPEERKLAVIFNDIYPRKRAEALVQDSLAEKEELLKEVHHRVKNNLQVIISLLNLQASSIEDARVLGLFQETRNRVLAIAAIHELLYRAASFASISLSDYARQLAPDLLRFYGLEQRVELAILGDSTSLELERAVPYGMLLNELVSNACKHAFPTPRTGSITIRIQPENESKEIVLTVADTGRGLPKGFDYQKASSLGLRLVHGLVRQLRGTIEMESRSGTIVIVRLPATGEDKPE